MGTENVYITENIKYVDINSYKISLDELEKIIENNKNEPFVLLEDKNLVSIFSKEEQFEMIDYHFSNNVESDLLFLSNFSDDISRIKKPVEYPVKKEFSFYETFSPNGISGTVSTPEKWIKIINFLKNKDMKNVNTKLNLSIITEEIKAHSVWPRVFYQKLENFDSMYHNPFRNNEEVGRKIPNTEKFSYNWFLITLFITVLFFAYFYDKLPKNRYFLVKHDKAIVVDKK